MKYLIILLSIILSLLVVDVVFTFGFRLGRYHECLINRDLGYNVYCPEFKDHYYGTK